ncbi:MAG: aminotransferase class I/II-fold pyridoxal phosphate-dependent enzyme [Propionibacteriaceae bacterium]|nr:aminotransferase class I/II-fold pyridoxal phosphate-dependent enzyme [Propionibacteriaceae bacterium]
MSDDDRSQGLPGDGWEDDEHGGDLAAHPGVVLDYSTNVSPLGLSPAVRRAIVERLDDYAAYPDPRCRALRAALARQHQVDPANILCGNGAADLIHRVCAALRPRRALTWAPSFSEYQRCAALGGAVVEQPRLDPADGFRLTAAAVAAVPPGVELVFCCQPNNPTGRLVEPAVLDQLVERCRLIGAVLVCDECFLPFTAAGSLIPQLARQPHVIVLSALTKTHALAGLRLGYAVGHPDYLALMAEHGPRWGVSAVAQAAGLAALAEPERVAEARRLVALERPWVEGELVRLGLRTFPGEANFILFQSSVDLFQPLLEQGVLIRSGANFSGLDKSYYRVAIKCHTDNVALVKALGEVRRG